jgi:hypothetical protein
MTNFSNCWQENKFLPITKDRTALFSSTGFHKPESYKQGEFCIPKSTFNFTKETGNKQHLKFLELAVCKLGISEYMRG